MEEKRLEYLTMLQIHQSDTPSIDAVIDRFATIAARRLNFYRATLYVSAVFAVVQCPSIRSSVTLVLVSRRLKILSNFFLGAVAQSL